MRLKYTKSINLVSTQLSKSSKSAGAKISKEHRQLLLQRWKRLVNLLQTQMRLSEFIKTTEKLKQTDENLKKAKDGETKRKETKGRPKAKKEIKESDKKEDKGMKDGKDILINNQENVSKITKKKIKKLDKNNNEEGKVGTNVTAELSLPKRNTSLKDLNVNNKETHEKEVKQLSQSQNMLTTIRLPEPMWEKVKSGVEEDIISVLNIPGVRSKPPNKVAVGNQECVTEKMKLSDLLHNAEYNLKSPLKIGTKDTCQDKYDENVHAEANTKERVSVADFTEGVEEASLQPVIIETPEDPLVDFENQQMVEGHSECIEIMSQSDVQVPQIVDTGRKLLQYINNLF